MEDGTAGIDPQRSERTLKSVSWVVAILSLPSALWCWFVAVIVTAGGGNLTVLLLVTGLLLVAASLIVCIPRPYDARRRWARIGAAILGLAAILPVIVLLGNDIANEQLAFLLPSFVASGEGIGLYAASRNPEG